MGIIYWLSISLHFLALLIYNNLFKWAFCALKLWMLKGWSCILLILHKHIHITNFRNSSNWPCSSQSLCLNQSLCLEEGSDLISHMRRLKVTIEWISVRKEWFYYLEKKKGRRGDNKRQWLLIPGNIGISYVVLIVSGVCDVTFIWRVMCSSIVWFGC